MRKMKKGAANAYAVILAGGNGERFWPISTAERPKQFLSLFGGKPLIRHAVDRLAGLIPPERVLVITAQRLVAQTIAALPMVPRANIIGEPCRRDTAAAVAVACGLVKRLGGENAVACVLTADHLIEPASGFRKTLKDSIVAATHGNSVVTIGIKPDYPATGFGYIESGRKLDFGTKTVFHAVRRFVEKPDTKTAAKYLKTGRFSWNSGMFIWKASVMEGLFASSAPDFYPLISSVASARRVESALRKLYPPLRAISFDYAVMEKTADIIVAESAFQWDDVGSWLAIPHHFLKDDEGNARIGRTALLDASGNIVVSDENHLTAVVGLSDVVVVHTAQATLVCSKDKVQDVKKLVKTLG